MFLEGWKYSICSEYTRDMLVDSFGSLVRPFVLDPGQMPI